jgi:hypothetical protein
VLKKLAGTIVIAAFSLSVVACSSKGDCKKMADHVMSVMLGDMVKDMPADQKDKVLAEGKAEMIKECEKKDFSKKQEECVLKGKTLEDFSKCDKL